MSWSAVNNATSYRLHYRPVGNANWTNINNITATNRIITGLQPNVQYEIEIRSVCGQGILSDWGQHNTFTTLACNAPATVATDSVTPTRAWLRWSSAPNAQGYQLHYRRVGDTVWQQINVSDTVRLLTNLSGGTTYEFQARTKCANNRFSDWSVTGTFTTGPCDTPPGITVSNITYTQAVISWQAVNYVQRYEIRYRVVGSQTWVYVNTTQLSRNLTGLLQGTTYEYEVRAKCGNNVFSDWSTTETFTTIGCGIPSNLQAQNITQSTATLSWNAVPNAQNYELSLRQVGGIQWSFSNAVSNTKTLTGLNPCSEYEVRLRTRCANNLYSDYAVTYYFHTQNLYAPVQVNLGLDTSFYNQPFCLLLDAGNPGLRYLWSTGDTTQTIFYCPLKSEKISVQVLNNNCVVGVDTIHLKYISEFDRIFEIQDRWGKKFTLGDIAMLDTITPNVNQRIIYNSESNCLVENGPNHPRFRIVFQDVLLNNNFGFDDDSRNVTVFVGSQPQTITIGAARRRVVCQTFDDLSRLLITPEAEPDYVNILISNSAPVNQNDGFIARATPFLVVPAIPSPNTIIYGETAKTIQSGKDSYAQILQNLNADPFLYFGQSRVHYFHGQIQYNFRNISFDQFVDFDRLSPLPALNQIDMYAVTLHEIQHLLGFISLINDNGQSYACIGCYSKFDTYLKGKEVNNTYQNLISSGGCHDNQYNQRMFDDLDVVNANCTPAPPAIIFEGNYTLNVPILTGSNPSRMSHFYSHPDCNQTCHYTICFSMSGGEPSYKRTMLDDEVKTLCDLGYQLDSDYGYDNCPDGFFQNDPVSRPRRYQTYNACQPCNPIGRVDTGTVEVDVTSRIYPMLNDLNTTAIECVDILYGNADINFTPLYIDITPRSLSNNIVIRYIPKNATCKGAETYIVLKIRGFEPIIDTVICDNSPCAELICNGTMENFYPYEGNYVEPHYWFQVNDNGLNTPDMLLNGVLPAFNNQGGGDHGCPLDPNNLTMAHSGVVRTMLYFSNQYRPQTERSANQEGLVFRLNTPLRSHGKYRFSIWTKNVSCPEPAALIAGFSKQYPCENGIYISNGMIENSTCLPSNTPFRMTTQRRWGHDDLIPSLSDWYQLTWDFCAADSNDGDEFLYVFIDADRNHPLAFPSGFALYIDDVSLIPDPSGSVSITTNPNPPVKCPDGCVELTANASGIPCEGTPSFSWTPSIGLNTTEGNIVKACANTTQTYTVTAMTPNGCTSTASVTVTVSSTLSPPPLTTEVQNPIVCGDTSLITVNTSPNATINWEGAPFLVCNERGDTCRAFPRQPGNYQYHVEATVGGCTARDTVNLTVAPLHVEILASNTNVCINTPLTLQVTTNAPGVTLTWDNLQHLSCNPNQNQCVFQSPVIGTFRYIVTGTRGNFCIGKDTIDISVFNNSFGGNIINPQTICAGQIPNPLILTNFGNGTIQRWESQDQCTGAWQTIANTQVFYQPPALQNTVCYRAVVKNAGCDEAFSTIYTLTVNRTQGGNVIKDQTICAGTAPQTLNLVNHNGNVLRWEQSTNNGLTWNIIPHTLTSYIPPILTTTTLYRAVVWFNPCSVETSAVATVTVIPQPNGGSTRLQQAQVCLNTNANLYLDGYSGTVLQWEYAPDCSGPWTIVPSNLSTFSRNLTQATCFRALVGREPCPPSYSEQINIAPTPCNPCDLEGQTQIFAHETGFCEPYPYWRVSPYACLYSHGFSTFSAFGKDYYIWEWDTTGMQYVRDIPLATDRNGNTCFARDGYCEILAGDSLFYNMQMNHGWPSKRFRVIGRNIDNNCADTTFTYVSGTEAIGHSRPADFAVCAGTGTMVDMRGYGPPDRRYFYWEPMTGVTFLDSLNGPRVMFNPTVTTTYTFHRYPFRGFYENHPCEQCEGTNIDTLKVTVYPSPTDITYTASPGVIEVTSVTGGTPPYLYQAIGPNLQILFQPVAEMAGLDVGDEYEVSVKDANGCIYTYPLGIMARLSNGNYDTKSNIRIYPNPAQNFVMISYQVNEETDAWIEVYNAVGAVIYWLKIPKVGDYEIDTHSWSSGMYFIDVKNKARNSLYHGKLIITR